MGQLAINTHVYCGKYHDKVIKRTEQGQHKEIWRTKKTNKDIWRKPRTHLRQAEDKKGLAKGSHRGKVQFYWHFLYILLRYELKQNIKDIQNKQKFFFAFQRVIRLPLRHPPNGPCETFQIFFQPNLSHYIMCLVYVLLCEGPIDLIARQWCIPRKTQSTMYMSV